MAFAADRRLLARLVLLGLLALAWADPPAPWSPPNHDVIVVTDVSASVDGEARQQAHARVARWFEQSNVSLRVAQIRFAGQPDLARPLTPWRPEEGHQWWADADRRAPDGSSATDIDAALAAALRLADPDRPTSLLLLTDGRETGGTAAVRLRQAREAGIPVRLLELPSRAMDGACRLQSLATRDRVGADQSFAVDVFLAGNAGAAGAVALTVDGRPLADRRVHIDASGQGFARFRVDGLTAGTARITATPDGTHCVGRPISRIVNVDGPSRILYVHAAGTRPPFAAALERGGWALRRLPPSRLAGALGGGATALVVLDDIAAPEIGADATEALRVGLDRGLLGLLVLGGPHSFGAGGYRRSPLEALLPVIAEGRDREDPSALMFVIDTSGSMAARDPAGDRLAIARAAIRQTLQGLRPDDAVGLIAFDVEAKVLVALGQHADAADRLPDSLVKGASGGTRVAAALTAGAAALSAAPQSQRILVLATDGEIGDESVAGLAARFAEQRIELVALAIGEDTDTAALERLAAGHRGRVMRVGHAADLPRLMRSEVEALRPAFQPGPRVASVVEATPFGGRPGAQLDGYMVSTARPAARRYLESDLGDPLLATMPVGSGLSAALPGGLGGWAASWLDQPESARWLGGLVAWLGPGTLDGWSIQAALDGDRWSLTVESADFAVDETGPPDGRILLVDPLGRPSEWPLEATAPGRWQATLRLRDAGVHRATAIVGDHRLSHTLLYGPEDELRAPPHEDAIRRWRVEGLATPWDETRHPADGRSGGLRGALLATFLALYLLLLVWERRPPRLASRAAAVLHRWRRQPPTPSIEGNPRS